MSLSVDQEARLDASLIDYRYKVFVAGPRGSVAEQDITEGQTYTAYPETTVAASFGPDDTELEVTSTTGFPTSGGLYLWPYASTQAGQFLKYSGKTSTVFQNVSSEETHDFFNQDTFSIGTTVSVWYEITNKVTSFNFNEVLQDIEATWTAQLNGVDYDSRLLAQNNMLMILMSYSPEPTDGLNWSDYTVLFAGYILPVSVQDDYQQGATWTLNVSGLNHYTSRADAEAKRYGRTNLLENSSATGSTYLPDSAVIGYPGEVVARQTMEPDKAVDGSVSTSYCSVAIPATTTANNTLAALPHPRICEVGFGPVGTGADGAYFVIWCGRDIPMNYFSIYNKQASANIYTSNNPTLPTYPAGSRIILCRNREVFESWAGPQDVEVWEWRWVNSDFVLDPAGDRLYTIDNWLDPDLPENQIEHIKWGSYSGATLAALNYGEAYYIPAGGTPITDPQWTLTDTPVPGRNAAVSTWAYLSAEVPVLAITLGQEMTNSSPATGESITLSPSTSGLNQAGGEIIIDTERITYTAATSTTITGITRGASSTTAALHTSGTNIYPVEDDAATQNDFIDYIGWKRKNVYDDGVAVVPEDFEVFSSTLASPTYPGTDTAENAWRYDWDRWSQASGHNGFAWNTPPNDGRRARHVMILCTQMLNEGRFLISEFEAKRKSTYDPTTTTVSTVGEIFSEMLVTDFGLNVGQVSISDLAAVSHDFVSTKGRLSERLKELARLVGAIIYYNRDNSITISPSPWHPLGGLTAVTHTLTRDNLRNVFVVESQRNAVSQVVVNVRNPQTKETFQVQFPPVALPIGDVVEAERNFLGSAREARYLAELMYKQANNQDRADVTLKGHGDGFRVGQRVLLTWDMDRSGTKFSGKNFIISGVSLSVSASAEGDKKCEWRLVLQEYLY